MKYLCALWLLPAQLGSGVNKVESLFADKPTASMFLEFSNAVVSLSVSGAR